MEEDRCRGHCCRCFVLSVPYEELKANTEKFKDGNQILDMLIPLGKMTHKESVVLTGATRSDETPSDEPMERFTCRHLTSGGDCGIYENRPWMCRSYPKLRCEYKECKASCGVLKAIRDKED